MKDKKMYDFETAINFVNLYISSPDIQDESKDKVVLDAINYLFDHQFISFNAANNLAKYFSLIEK